MKYINTDELKAFIDAGKYRNPCERVFSENDIIDMVNEMPAADVAEVVRCEDCKHLVEIDPDNLYVCARIDFGMDGEPNFLSPKTDFCSRGERKETE